MSNKQLNALGAFEDLELFDSKGNRVYEFSTDSDDGDWYKYTYDSNGNLLTYENSDGYWNKSTYDSKGNLLTYENSDGKKMGFDIQELNEWDENVKVFVKEKQMTEEVQEEFLTEYDSYLFRGGLGDVEWYYNELYGGNK